MTFKAKKKIKNTNRQKTPLQTYERDPEMDAKWHRYIQHKTNENRNELIGCYTDFIKNTAMNICRRLPSGATADIDDMCGEGVLALYEVIDSFDPTRGVKFRSFAQTRVWGAMIDHLRHLDWVPRLVRSRSGRINKLITEFYIEHGRTPSNTEIQKTLGLSDKHFKVLMKEAVVTRVQPDDPWANHKSTHFEKHMTLLGGVEDEESHKRLSHASAKQEVAELLTLLHGRDRAIIYYYYTQQPRVSMRKIAELMRMSESRLSQIHTVLINMLKVYYQHVSEGRRPKRLSIIPVQTKYRYTGPHRIIREPNDAIIGPDPQ